MTTTAFLSSGISGKPAVPTSGDAKIQGRSSPERPGRSSPERPEYANYNHQFIKERNSQLDDLEPHISRRSDLSISPSEPSIYDILAMPFKVLLGKALFLSTYPSHVIDTIKLMSKADSDSYVEQESYMNMFN